MQKTQKTAIKGFYYETTSEFNGAPIVVIFTGFAKTANRKMVSASSQETFVQSWILDRRTNPVSISYARMDRSICGDCPQRRSLKNGQCYVTLIHGPSSVYRAWKRGSYTKLDLSNPEHLAMFTGKKLRIGSYGDPAALKASFWTELLDNAKITEYTGYTHAFKEPRTIAYKSFVMASADSSLDAEVAKNSGFRYFRARYKNEPLQKGEFICPASQEANKRLTCSECMSCNGTQVKETGANPVIIRHGVISNSKRFQNFEA